MNKHTVPPPPRLALVPAAPDPPDRTYSEIGDDVARLSLELASALERDRLAPDERRALRTCFALAHQLSVKLLSVDEMQHAARVAALDARCVCGWDRGAHMVEAPHLCEEDERCPGFRDALDPLAVLAKAAAADTIPPEAPSTPTLVDAFEGGA